MTFSNPQTFKSSNHWGIFLLFSLLTISGCKKDTPPEKQASVAFHPNTQGVFVLNEGGYGHGNAEISYYDITKGTISNDIFKTANGRALGDVCQSMTLYRGLGYVVMNNSAKVEVIDPKTFVAKATISGLLSPRYMLPIDSTKAYVTDLYSNTISVVDLQKNIKTKDILCKGNTEELEMINGRAFVTNTGHAALYIVNTATDVLEDSIRIGFGSESIRKDKNGKLWVLCHGQKNTNVVPSICRVNPISKQVELTLSLTLIDGVSRLRINGSLDTLYYLNSGVYQMPISATAIPLAPLVPAAGRNFYGLNVDPNSGVVYVSDAKDYQQTATVYRYAPNGILINHFDAGIIAQGFCFY